MNPSHQNTMTTRTDLQTLIFILKSIFKLKINKMKLKYN